MRFHARRLGRDLRSILPWFTSISVCVFIVAFVSTLMGAFLHESAGSGTLSPTPPRAPLTFLRVVDPSEEIQSDVSDLDRADRLKTPGISLMMTRLSRGGSGYLALPMGAITSNMRIFPEMVSSGLAVAGDFPYGELQCANRSCLWGDLDRDYGAVSNSRIGTVAIQQEGAEPIRTSYVDGNGYVASTQGAPLVSFTLGDLEELGVFPPYTVDDVVRGYTCYCEVGQVSELARQMTQAERAAGSRRTFYAISYTGLIGPVERAGAALRVLNVVFVASVMAGISVFVLVANTFFWRRCRPNYLVEWHAGAAGGALLARQQAIAFGAVVFPAALGFLMAQAGLRDSNPPPLPAVFYAIVGTGLVALQLALLSQTWLAMRSEFRSR